jgi:hypothetical protein
VLVISEDPELSVALRDRLDRAYVTVREVRAAEAEKAVRGCRPCPWMVVGAGSEVPDAVLPLLARRPTLLLWRGAPPRGLPPHTRGLERFSDLAAVAEAAISAEVGGMRLAPGGGITMPDAELATSAALEALVASHPRPVFAPARHFRNVAAALESHGVALRLARTGAGGARLVAEAG